jgi:hypothetical protein
VKLNDDDVAYVVCMRQADLTMPYAPGSLPLSCRQCFEPVWISPEGLNMVREVSARVICQVCARDEYDTSTAKIVPPTRAQRRALRAHGWTRAEIKGAAEHARRFLEGETDGHAR